jgi:large subunit ribosomal protein L10
MNWTCGYRRSLFNLCVGAAAKVFLCLLAIPIERRKTLLAISREKKEAFVQEYTDKLSRSAATYITDYRGLTVTELGTLRAQLRDQGDVEFAIAKNTLLTLAFKEAGLPVPEEHLAGPTAVLFCFTDPVSPAKALKKYADQHDDLTIKGGVMGARVLTLNEVEGMASLPPREEILATLVGVIQGPAQSLFGTIIAPMREIAQVLHARAEGSVAEGE